ncbi:MAG: hypothetical protein MI739_04405, partial [Bacteroidales bacterium]|nr:hypothetical protein [Bacteroidales bacterium]
MKLYLKILILFVFVFCKLNLFSQSPRFETYKILKNKKNVEINTIFQDNIGYIWLGTNYGLVKYDGSEFVLFTKKDSLADNYITSINQDYKNNLWIGHKSGKISIYNRKHFAEFNPEEGVGTQEISSFFINNKNTVFFSTYGEGVYYYAGEKRKRLYNIDVDNGLIDSYVYDIVQDFNSNMYFATDKGISIYNIERKEFIDEITMSDGLPDNIVKHMIIDKNILWIAMEDAGVCKYNITNKQFSNINNWKFGSINSFIKLNDRELWLSTVRNGIVQINYDDNGNSYYTVYNENNKLANNRTKSIFKDRENNVWIGTRNGLSIRRNNNFEFLDKSSGLNIDHIFSLVIDDAGNYWIASNQGLFVLSKNNLGEIKQKHLHNLKSHSFIALYKDSKGFIWAGTYGTGVFKINPITYEYLNFNSRNGLSNDNIIHISENKDNIWLSTLGGGVIKYNEDSLPQFTIYTSKDGLTSDYIYSTFTDSKNRIWVTTDGGGVVYFYNDSIYLFQTKLDSVFKTVYSVIEDNKGNLWFNSPNNGLFWYNGNNFFNYNAENALRTNSVLSISTDQSMNPVIVSNEGVEIFDTHDSILKYYGESVGVAYKEPNLNSIFKDKESNIWIGTNNGILKLNSNTENEEKNNILPNIFITEKQVFNQPIPKNQISFKYNRNHLSFYYTGLWFSSSEKLLYRYKLQGYDLDWNAATNLRMVTYSSLPPGKYKFLVQVSYSEGKWIGSPNSEYSFKIRKPFWKTIWFLSLIIALVLFLIFIVVKARIRKLQRDKEILEEEVRKRTAEIEAQKDEIEKQRNHVIKQRDKIEFQNNEITSSIEYAS